MSFLLNGEDFDTNYVQYSLLGEGGVGKVFLYRHKSTNNFVAVKVAKFTSLADIRNRYITRSLGALEDLRHEHILTYHGHYQPSELEHRIVFEYMPGGDLMKLRENQPISRELIAKWVRQVALALQYMHSKNIMHRDVKPQNVLLSSTKLNEADAKLADFDTVRAISTLMTERIGTKPYFAPEVNRNSYDTKADVWSIGCLTYKLFTGRAPYRLYTDEEYKSAPDFSMVGIAEQTEAIAFIRRCLTFRPEDRPSVNELLTDPFLAPPPDPLPSLLLRNIARQADLALQLATLLSEVSAPLGKTCADNGYRMLNGTIDLVEEQISRKTGLATTARDAKQRAEDLSRLSEGLYEAMNKDESR